MVRALPILGILGALFGALLVVVLIDAAVFIVLVVAVVGSIVLLAQRDLMGAVGGLVVLLLSVLAALGLAGNVTTEKGAADFGFSEGAGVALGLAACLAVPVAATVGRWAVAEPRWLSIAGIACAVIAVTMAVANAEALDDNGNPYTIVTALFALATMAPMIAWLRAAGGHPVAAST